MTAQSNADKPKKFTKLRSTNAKIALDVVVYVADSVRRVTPQVYAADVIRGHLVQAAGQSVTQSFGSSTTPVVDVETANLSCLFPRPNSFISPLAQSLRSLLANGDSREPGSRSSWLRALLLVGAMHVGGQRTAQRCVVFGD
jgi:hypothetical protein